MINLKPLKKYLSEFFIHLFSDTRRDYPTRIKHESIFGAKQHLHLYIVYLHILYMPAVSCSWILFICISSSLVYFLVYIFGCCSFYFVHAYTLYHCQVSKGPYAHNRHGRDRRETATQQQSNRLMPLWLHATRASGIASFSNFFFQQSLYWSLQGRQLWKWSKP